MVCSLYLQGSRFCATLHRFTSLWSFHMATFTTSPVTRYAYFSHHSFTHESGALRVPGHLYRLCCLKLHRSIKTNIIWANVTSQLGQFHGVTRPWSCGCAMSLYHSPESPALSIPVLVGTGGCGFLPLGLVCAQQTKWQLGVSTQRGAQSMTWAKKWCLRN